MPTLYAWANPLSAWNGADHTWVTSYPDPFACPPPRDYWYCWGSCHPTGTGTTARALGNQLGDEVFANCICAANDRSAHGGIVPYGIAGVCHQLANRVLFATGPSPLTVSGAKMYWLSHLLFGTYGTTHVDWAARKRKCAPNRAALTMTKTDLAILDERIRKELGPRYTPDLASRLHSLQLNVLEEKKQLDDAVVAGLVSGREFAAQVNGLVRKYVAQVGEIIGPEQCRAIFDASPDEEIVIVDPDIAGNQDYQQ